MPSISILPLPSTNALASSSSSSSTTSPTRNFPFVGHLGLSPVVLEGLILSRLSAPEKPLLASSVEVIIRCVESRLSGAFGVLTSEVLFSSSQVVWRAGKSAPPREDGLVRRGVEEALGDWEGKFKIEIPLEEGRKAGRSTVSLREYRVVWKLEVVIHHRSSVNPNDRFSKSIEVPLLLHSSPPSPTLPPSDPSFSVNSYALVSSSTTLPSTIFPPLGAYGPGETIPIHLKGFLPSNRATVKKIVVSLRRRLEFLPATAATIAGEEAISSDWSSEVNTPGDDLGGAGGSSAGGEFYEMGVMDSSLSVASYSTTSPLLLSPTPSSSSRGKPTTSSRLTSFFSPRSSSSSLPSRRARSPSLEPSSLSSRSASASSSSSSVGGSGSGGKKSRRASTPPTSSEVLTTKVLEVESDAIRAVGLKEWEADVEMVLPRVKGSSRWTMGETGRTGMMSLGFELKVTVVVQPASSSASDPPQSSSSSSSSSFITPSAILLPFPRTFPVTVTSTSQSDRSSAALLTVPISQPRTRSSSSRSKISPTTRSSSSTATPTSPSRPRPARPSMGTRSTSASSSSSMYSLGNGSSFRGLEGDVVEQPRMSRSSGRSRRSDDSGGALSPLGPPSPRADPRTSYRSPRTSEGLSRATRDEHRSLLSPRNGPSQSSLSSSSNASTSTVRLQAYSPQPTSDLPTSFSTTSFESNDSASTTTSHHPSRPSTHLSPPSSYSSAFHRQIVSNLSTDTFDLGLPPLPVSSPSASSTTTFHLLTPPPAAALQHPIPSSSKSSKLGRFLSLSPPTTTKEEDAKRLMATLIQGGRRISINPSEEEEDHPRRRVKVGVTGGEIGWGEGVVNFSPVAFGGEKARSSSGSSKRRPSTAPGGPVGVFGFGWGG